MKKLLRLLLGCLFKVRARGLAQLQFSGPSLILPNHVSFLDAVLLYAWLPGNVCFVVNTAIAGKISFLLRFVEHITVDPLNPYSLKKIINMVKNGQPVVFFPEGRLTMTGGLMKVYNGAGMIVLRSNAAIYPVILRGTEFSKVTRITDKMQTRWFPQVDIFAGPPVELAVDPSIPMRRQKKVLSDKILALLQENAFQARHQAEKSGNLFDRLLEVNKLYGAGAIAAEDIGGKISRRQLIMGSYALAGKLRAELAEEDCVGVLLPNSIGHIVALFSLFYLAKTPAILNFSAGAANNVNCSQTANVKTILTSRQFIEKGNFHDLAAALGQVARLIYLEDVKEQIGFTDKISAFGNYLSCAKAKGEGRLILFTSGSESKPKGVVLKHANILANLNQIASIIDYTPRDKMLNALPMFHSLGLTGGTFLPLLGGFQLFLYPTPLHYKIIPEIIYDRNVTVVIGTPTFLAGYGKYAHPYDFYSIRYVLAGGEKLKDEVRILWQEKFGLRIFEGYGATETAPVLSIGTPLFYKTGTTGRMFPGIKWRLEEVPGIENGGNLLVQGPNVMEGYMLADKGFSPAADWYDCGDIVTIDEEGFVSIKSRLKRFAKISGEMVSLDAVEKTAEKCFGTEQNAAINMPDAKKGEKILLYTTNKTASKQALREFLSKSGESMLSMPADIVIVEKLPLLGSGKTDYVTLKTLAQKDAE